MHDLIMKTTIAFQKMAAMLRLSLIELGKEVVFFDPKKRQNSILKIIEGTNLQLRHHIEKGDANAVIWLELDPKPDKLHSRRSSLNQVMAKIFHAKNCIVLFDHSIVRKHKGSERAKLIGRMQQNVMLCRKYHVQMAIVTMASSPFHLRNPHDLHSFGIQLGMQPQETIQALNAINEYLQPAISDKKTTTIQKD